MVIKERRTKILLSLILLSDVNLTNVKFDDRLQTVFELTLNQKTRGTISSMLREGKIKSEVSGSYQLTEKGFYSLCLRFPYFRFLRDSWDRKLRILSYEIPEKKRELRDRLRREIAGWGLGPWHRSFWLTPHPIIENLRELVYQKEEEQYLQAFESQHVAGNLDVLIEKVWQKSTLDKKYRDLFKSWHGILSGSEEKLAKFKNVVNQYVEILKSDPGLPPELIGKNWIGFEAFNIFKEIRTILLT